MKSLSSLFLLLATADAFSPPNNRLSPTQPSSCTLSVQTSSTADGTSTDYVSTPNSQPITPEELAKRQHHKNTRQIWGRRMKFSAKPDNARPFHELSLEELKILTEYHLGASDEDNNDGDEESGAEDVNIMSSYHVHEVTKLLSSWAKLSVAGYISNVDTGDAVMLSKKEKVVAAEMAEKCLRRLVEEEKGGNERAVVTVDLYHLVITAWIKSRSHSDLIHAQSLLDYMEANGHSNITENGPWTPKPYTSQSSAKCYVAVLDGWCKSPFKDAELHAEGMLRRMTSLKIYNSKHYNNVMNRLASGAKSNAGAEAERLLNEMIEMYKAGNLAVTPNRNSFNTVIKAYANSGGKNGARNAKRILGMMENPSKFGLGEIASEIEPDRISCTSIMMAWANSNDAGGCEVDAGEKAEQLLRRMEGKFASKGDVNMRPDTATYNAVIKVWGKCGHTQAAQKSEELLNKMLEQYQNGTNTDAKPDDVTFNSVIHNVATSLDMDSPQRTLNILEKMQDCHDHGLIDVKPDIITYNSVLNSFARSNRPESAERAEEILTNLEKSYDSGAWNIQPDVYSYNTVINAWSKSNVEDSAQRAVALLDRMSARAKEGKSNVKPDPRTYNTVLNAWSQSTDKNAPIKALGLLELMFRRYENGDENAQPDVLSFSTVINAFSKSKFPWKARECRSLLRRMKDLYDDGEESMRPNIFVYSAVLNACAYTFGRPDEKEEALNIGIETFEELKQSGIRPNHVAYGSYLRICRRLISEDDARRSHFITRAFQQCCADGQVGLYVLKQIRADPKLFVKLLQPYIQYEEVLIDDLPLEWTRNVKERQKISRPRFESRSKRGYDN